MKRPKGILLGDEVLWMILLDAAVKARNDRWKWLGYPMQEAIGDRI